MKTTDTPCGLFTATTEQLRAEARQTPAGKLLVRYGFEPWDTESSARLVAEKAAAEITELTAAMKGLLAGTALSHIESDKLTAAREILNRLAP